MKSDDTIGHYLSAFVLLTAVRNFLWLNNSAEGAHCFVSMATLDGFILLTATCSLGTIQRGRTLALPWQQWLRERATILPYTYISLVVCFNPHRCK